MNIQDAINTYKTNQKAIFLKIGNDKFVLDKATNRFFLSNGYQRELYANELLSTEWKVVLDNGQELE